MRAFVVAGVIAAAGCDSDVTRPDPGVAPIELEARVNVQLGDTRAGQAPIYVVTGEAVATQAGIPITATIDSIVVTYRLQDGPWLPERKATAFPVSDVLPFTAQVDQQYSVRAVVYAHASRTGTTTVRAQDEWIASARGIAATH
jgi:hypothetical protein